MGSKASVLGLCPAVLGVGGAAKPPTTFAAFSVKDPDAGLPESWPAEPPMDTEWEGSGELCPAFDIPVTRLFADIVSEDSVAPRDPELRLQHVEIFNFGVNDNSAILASDSDTDSTVYEYEAEPVTEEPVVPPPPPPCFGGALPLQFHRMALPLLLTATILCFCVTATPATAFGVGGVTQTSFDTTILTVGGAARVVPVRPEPPPTLPSPSISDLSSTSTPTSAAEKIVLADGYLTLLRAGTRVPGSTPSD
ncbi:hypothetical protein CYMTET_54405 [Cymbomonas tetramitiformis]|uniref:Uncharacterized protein n=1 Tax=Cymbomonas tetramitiformis TaxID=36881 RepID=A0AAE0EPD6_9CHLO|nr:hypothetical protein CYMTET_54405 [Cymbomonas tetramitiformis]